MRFAFVRMIVADLVLAVALHVAVLVTVCASSERFGQEGALVKRRFMVLA
jgi:hypothetical protein